MYKKILLSALVATAIAGGTTFSLVYADDRVEAEKPDVEITDDGRKFDDSQLLKETLIGWQKEEVIDAKQDVKDAYEALKNADPNDPDEIAELKKNLTDAKNTLSDTVADFKKEKRRLTKQVNKLSDEQVFALNRSLNNAVNNGLIVDLNSDYMRALLKGNYNKQQINSLTKALEEEAKFEKLSDKFTSKYDYTGNEKFMDKADMMTDKGERQKDKFLAKIDKFDRDDFDEVEHHNKVRKAARDNAKSTVRDASKDSARKNAKKSAKNDAKKSAKNDAKESAKETAKNSAKASAKNNAKESAKNSAKKSVKNNAKKKT